MASPTPDSHPASDPATDPATPKLAIEAMGLGRIFRGGLGWRRRQALNEVDLFYATVPQQRVTQRQLAKRQPVRTHMGHALWAWSKAPAREPVGPPLESITTRPPPAPLRIELQALPVKTRYSCSSACSGCARAPVPCTSGCSG